MKPPNDRTTTIVVVRIVLQVCTAYVRLPGSAHTKRIIIVSTRSVILGGSSWFRIELLVCSSRECLLDLIGEEVEQQGIVAMRFFLFARLLLALFLSLLFILFSRYHTYIYCSNNRRHPYRAPFLREQGHDQVQWQHTSIRHAG